MSPMFFTLLVSNGDKSIDDKPEQPANMRPMYVTLLVSDEDKSIDDKPEQP